MASPLPKQLGEFLQEQQEPFTLPLYLLERGHVSCNSNSEPSFLDGGSANYCKFLKGINLLPRCSQLMKAVLGKLSLVDTNPKIKKIQDSAESDNFSSASSGSTILVNSCSDSDAEDVGQKRFSSTLHEKQVKISVSQRIYYKYWENHCQFKLVVYKKLTGCCRQKAESQLCWR